MVLSQHEDQSTPSPFPAQPTANLRIASIPRTPRPPHRKEQLHILTVPSQPKNSDTSETPTACLLENGTGVQAARVQGQIKGHRALEVTYRGKQGMGRAERTRNSPGGQKGTAGDSSPELEDTRDQVVLSQRGLTQPVLGTSINAKADIGITQFLARGCVLLTLIHRPSNLCRCYMDVHPHPQHRSGPAGRMQS